MTDAQIFDRIKRMLDNGDIAPAYVCDPEDGFYTVGYQGERDGVIVEITVQLPEGEPPCRENLDMCEARYLRVA